MDLKKNILEAIGNTPLVRINSLASHVKGELYAKCEFTNPGGSIKDRIGHHMIEAAEARGDLKPGGTIVEGTSGNTGMGLAITAALKGYKTVFVMPDKMSEEKRQNLRAFGAKVVITPTAVAPDSPESYYSVSKRLAEEIPNSIYINQYDNLDNRETHIRYTGPELYKQLEGKVDAVVVGMGTCGTITGLGMYLKKQNPNIKIIGVDPKGSILKDLFDTGKPCEAHGYLIEGIGEDIVPKNLDFSVIDKIIRVQDKESFLMTRRLLVKEGIFAGVSSGAALVGALKYMEEEKNPGRVVVILPDSGNRYLSKVYTDAWMIENGFVEAESAPTVGRLVRLLQIKNKPISASNKDSVGRVVKVMREAGVSQLPVLVEGEVVGVISETDLLRPLFSGSITSTDSIEPLISKDFFKVCAHDPIKELQKGFQNGKIALYMEGKRLEHILSKIDLITYLNMEVGSLDE